MGSIKLRELSIDDWVRVYGKFCKILMLSTVGACHFKASDGSIYRSLLADATPIHITPEILEKNGFEKERSSYVTHIGEYRIYVWLKKYSHFVDIVKMKGQFASANSCIEVEKLYVHTLQHALRLAGIEKEIEL